MSGNTAEGHSIQNRESAQGSLELMLDLLWIKLDERFGTMGQAFRYFDKNYNNRVSFGEFQKSLDHLRIKFQVDMIDKIFQSLDKDKKGYISYQDFANLAEETRRNIDPFKSSHVPQDPEQDKPENYARNYLKDINYKDLELMSKWKSPKNSELPKKFSDETHRFGKPSPDLCDMKGIINNEFNR